MVIVALTEYKDSWDFADTRPPSHLLHENVLKKKYIFKYICPQMFILNFLTSFTIFLSNKYFRDF